MGFSYVDIVFKVHDSKNIQLMLNDEIKKTLSLCILKWKCVQFLCASKERYIAKNISTIHIHTGVGMLLSFLYRILFHYNFVCLFDMWVSYVSIDKHNIEYTEILWWKECEREKETISVA